MEAELQLLSKCPADKIEKLLHCIIDCLYGQRPPLFCDYSEIWSLSEWWDINNSLKKFFCNAVKYVENKEQVLKTLSHLPLYKEVIFTCLTLRKNDIEKALIEKTNSICDNYLIDFDWKLKVILASDSLYNVREPCMELAIEFVTDEKKKQLCIEMSKEELKNFIDILETAHKKFKDDNPKEEFCRKTCLHLDEFDLHMDEGDLQTHEFDLKIDELDFQTSEFGLQNLYYIKLILPEPFSEKTNWKLVLDLG